MIREVARESSWAGGRDCVTLYPWRYSLAVTALANWAQEYYPQLVRELLAETGVDAEFEPCGLLMLDAPDQSDAVSWAVSEDKAMEVWEPTESMKQSKNWRRALARVCGCRTWVMCVIPGSARP